MARELLRWHRRLGWALGGLFAFQGLTGTAIVFRPELDRALHPAEFGPLAPGRALPPARLLAAAQAAFTGKGEVTALVLPTRPGEPAVARVTFGPERHAEASVDPASGRVFAPRVYEGSLLGTIYDLHNLYVLRDVGYRGVGVAGLLMLASVFAGVRMAWPRRGGLVRALAPPPAGAHPVRTLRDTHARLGLVAAPLLVVALVTGAWMSLGDLARPALGRLGTVEPRLDHPPPSRAGALIPPEQALAAATAALPGEELAELRLPEDAQGSYVVLLRGRGPQSVTRPPDRVVVDRASGRVLAVLRASDLPPLERLWQGWLYPLHNGQALGPLHRTLVALLGLSPAALFGLALIRGVLRRRAAAGHA